MSEKEDKSLKRKEKKEKKKKIRKEKKKAKQEKKDDEDEIAKITKDEDSYDADKDEMKKEITKKSKRKEKKERKRKRSDRPDDDNNNEDDVQEIEGKSKASKENDNDDDDDDDDNSYHEDVNENSNAKDQKRCERKKRRLERQKLLDKVPKADEHGIAYTKQQIRRMRKRVARGLDPIETDKEVQERLRREAELRKEEEQELSGMLYDSTQKEEPINEEDDSDANDNEEEVDGDESDQQKKDPDSHDDDSDEDQTSPEEPKFSDTNHQSTPPSSKKPRHSKKPVPPDYVCSACKNKHVPRHWIYDCPDKVTKRGTNQVSKKLKGVHDPDHRKVFVSGLPFDAKMKDVTNIFAGIESKVVKCKFIRFPDTGRCKGQAYVTFETEAGAKKALALSGTKIDNAQEGHTHKRMQLDLKVKKCLNRFDSRKRQKKAE